MWPFTSSTRLRERIEREVREKLTWEFVKARAELVARAEAFIDERLDAELTELRDDIAEIHSAMKREYAKARRRAQQP